MLSSVALAQKTYNSFADFFANTPDDEEAIVNFTNAQVLYKNYWDDDEGRVYYWFIKDATLAIELNWRSEQTWKEGDMLNGKLHVTGIHEDDFSWNRIEVVNNEENAIQVSGNEDIVPLEVKFSELSPKTHCNEVVHIKADVINVKNETEDYWTMTDGGEHEASWEGDVSKLRYDTYKKEVRKYIEFETYDDYIEAYENNQFVRRGVDCIAAIARGSDEEGEWLRIFPIEILDVYDYVPVTFKEKFEGYTSFFFDMYAGKDNSLWSSADHYFSYNIPKGVKVKTYAVEGGKGHLKDAPEGFQSICHLNPVILELEDKSFENGDVTVEFRGFWDHWSNGYRFSKRENMLYGYNTAEETSVDGDTESYKFYRLTLNAKQDKGSIGFYWGAEDGGPFTTSPHKIFLAVPRDEANNASFFRFDNATDINEVNSTLNESNTVYTLSGVRVNSGQINKGVYISNGKKIVIK